MLVPTDMIGPQSKLQFQVNKYYGERVHARKYTVGKTICDVCKVVQDILKEVEVQEPRFISSLTEINGRYDNDMERNINNGNRWISMVDTFYVCCY